MHTRFLSILLALALAGCGTEALFHADFESDAPGEIPMSNPPGEPEGDSIWIPQPDEGLALVVNAGNSGKSLRLSGPQTPFGAKQVSFVTAEGDLTADYFWAAWNGRVEAFDESADAIQFSFGNVELGYASFRILDGKLWTRETHDKPWEAIGPIEENETHSIILQLDIKNRTFNAVVFQPGENLTVEPRPLHSPSSVRQRNLKLSVFFEGEGQGDVKYLIDNISISVRRPEVMTPGSE